MTKHVFRIALKDFEVQLKSLWNYTLLCVAYVLVFSFMPINQKQFVFSFVAFVLIYSFVNKSLYLDEKNDTLRLLDSLPVGRETIVYARYLSTGFMIVLLGLILGAAMIFTGGSSDRMEQMMMLAIVILTFMVFVLIMCVYLPLAFKLGYIRAATINRFLFLGIFAVFGAVPLAISKAAKGKIKFPEQQLDAFISSLDPVLTLIVLIGLILLIYIASMELSLRFYKKRRLY